MFKDFAYHFHLTGILMSSITMFVGMLIIFIKSVDNPWLLTIFLFYPTLSGAIGMWFKWWEYNYAEYRFKG